MLLWANMHGGFIIGIIIIIIFMLGEGLKMLFKKIFMQAIRSICFMPQQFLLLESLLLIQ